MNTGIFDRAEIIQLWALGLIMFANLFLYVLHKWKGANASPFTWRGLAYKVLVGIGAWILLLLAASGLKIEWASIHHDNPYFIVICLQYGANAEYLVGAYFQQWIEKKVADRRSKKPDAEDDDDAHGVDEIGEPETDTKPKTDPGEATVEKDEPEKEAKNDGRSSDSKNNA